MAITSGSMGPRIAGTIRPTRPIGGSLSQGPTRRGCVMSRASLNYALLFLGMAVMAFSGTRLGIIVGVTWEFAAFATGILVSAACCARLLCGAADQETN